MKFHALVVAAFLVGCSNNGSRESAEVSEPVVEPAVSTNPDAETTVPTIPATTTTTTGYAGEVVEAENPQNDQILQFFFKLRNASRVEIQVMSNEQAGSYDITTATTVRLRLPQGQETQAQYNSAQGRLIADLPAQANPPMTFNFTATIAGIPDTSGTVTLKQLSPN